ncbi:MAG TPA: ABC transporter permease subunit [Ignavibacteria bacterium]|nr:ABC transporter permease subunit [Ignavibacteria bacterium]
MDKKIFKYILFDLLRNKFILIYSIILMVMSFSIIYIGHDSSKAVITILNLILFIIPLICLIFGTIHFYNSREFIQFLLTQPVNRKNIFRAEYLALSVSLSLGFLIGVGFPVMLYGLSLSGLYLIVTGISLTFIFTALAFLSSVLNKDKVKGIGLSIIIWLYLTIIFDGLVFLVIYFFNDYPIDRFIIILTSLNPIDLGRILMLLQVDVSALMGFTGATFQKFFGSILGKAVSILFMLLWIILPLFISVRIFKKTNF